MCVVCNDQRKRKKSDKNGGIQKRKRARSNKITSLKKINFIDYIRVHRRIDIEIVILAE